MKKKTARCAKSVNMKSGKMKPVKPRKGKY